MGYRLLNKKGYIFFKYILNYFDTLYFSYNQIVCGLIEDYEQELWIYLLYESCVKKVKQNLCAPDFECYKIVWIAFFSWKGKKGKTLNTPNMTQQTSRDKESKGKEIVGNWFNPPWKSNLHFFLLEIYDFSWTIDKLHDKCKWRWISFSSNNWRQTINEL